MIFIAGVFLYRTVEDLNNITGFASKSKNAVVIGGGLLGLEAAKACLVLGMLPQSKDKFFSAD
jgi:nitrite reductase (NADH) large subunit